MMAIGKLILKAIRNVKFMAPDEVIPGLIVNETFMTFSFCLIINQLPLHSSFPYPIIT